MIDSKDLVNLVPCGATTRHWPRPPHSRGF